METSKKLKHGVWLRDPASGRPTVRGGTWLADFINARLDAYVEPQRKGTPKGEPIGFSRVKYMATLFRLRDSNLKQLGDQLGVPHVRMGQWNTEPAFKRAVDEHRRAFADVFFKNILNAIDEHDKALRARWQLTPKQLASTPSPSLPSFLSGLGDFHQYSADLRTRITNQLSAEWKRRAARLADALIALEQDGEEDDSAQEALADARHHWLSFLGVWKAFVRFAGPTSSRIQNLDELERTQAVEGKRMALALIKRLAVKPSLSDEDRKMIIVMVDALEHMRSV